MLAMGNFLQNMCAKNYQNRAWFDKVIAKIKWCSFVYSHVRSPLPAVLSVGMTAQCNLSSLADHMGLCLTIQFAICAVSNTLTLPVWTTTGEGGRNLVVGWYCLTLIVEAN